MKSEHNYKSMLSYFLKILPVTIIFFGIFLRLDQLLFNRSLWLDEAFLATGIVNGSLIDFFRPQEYSHVVPTGFLLLIKLCILQFGNNDFILRLFPFIAGITSLLIFYKVAENYVSRNAAFIALFLFAISDRLIFYSSELKPYSTDVLVSLVILFVVAHIQKNKPTVFNMILLGFTGAIAMWFSHPSMFVLGGVGIYLAQSSILRKDWRTMGGYLIAFLMWAIIFVAVYIMFIKGYENPWLLKFWDLQQAFMPLSISCIKWLMTTFVMIFKNPGGFVQNKTALVAGLIFLFGCAMMYRNRRDKLCILVLPILIAVIVSAFKKYPFNERMILFLLPSLYMIIAEGIDSVSIKNNFVKHAAMAILIIMLCYQPANSAIYHLRHKRVVQEIKPVLKYVRGHMYQDDIVYVYYWAEPAFRYYADFYSFDYNKCAFISPEPENEYVKEVDYYRRSPKDKTIRLNGYFPDYKCILGISEEFAKCKPEIDLLRVNRRVWFIFTHSDGADFLRYLDSIGTRLDSNLQPGAAAYLYDLGGPLTGEQNRESDSRVQKNGLIAEYLFNGDAEDSSGNPNHGIAAGVTLTEDRFGRKNNAYLFDGEKSDKADDIIIIKHDDILNQNTLTLSVWINGNHPVGYARIIDMLRWEAKEGFDLMVDEAHGGKIAFEFFNNNREHCFGVETTSSLKNDLWQHIVLTYNGSQAKIYYNGILENVNNDACKNIRATTRFLSFGNGYDDNRYWPFKGKIDDIRIYNRALTEKEIQKLYTESMK